MAGLNESRIAHAHQGALRASSRAASQLHAQHVVTVLVGLDGDVAITHAHGRCRGRAVIVPPDLPHTASSDGPLLCFMFDPERTGARHLVGAEPTRFTGATARRIAGRACEHAAQLFDPRSLAATFEDVARIALPPPPRLDRRVAGAIERWRDPETMVWSVAAMARQLRISPAHLRDVFQRATGVSPRRYRRWSLLVRSLRLPAGDATSRAHAAGFADLAHFTRTCRAFFGYTPSQIIAAMRR